jgi:hypothetical protein
MLSVFCSCSHIYPLLLRDFLMVAHVSSFFFWWTPKNPTFGWGPVLSSFGLQRFTLFGRETFVVALLGASE